MANNNVQNVRFLRNGSLYATRDAALTGLNGQPLAAEQDGSIILARYGSGDAVKTLVGLVYVNGGNKSLTIFDIEGASGDVEKLRQEINAKLGEGVGSGASETVTAQLTALSGNSSTDTSATTSVEGAKKYAKNYTDEQIGKLEYAGVTTSTGVYVTNVTETDGLVSATTATLPSLTEVHEAGKPIIAVAEDKGQLAASAGTINAEFVNIADGGGKFIATTVEGALAEIATEIDAMDLAVVSGDGEVITAVSEEDGKVSASKTPIKDVKLSGYVKDDSKTGAIANTDDVEDALSKIENNIAAAQSATTLSAADKSINVVTGATGTTVALNIRSGEKVLKLDTNATSGGVYTNLNVVKITNGLPAEIKERYELRDSDDAKIGESIDIAKDSHIVSIKYITTGEHAQNLEYVYIDASGNTQTTYIDMSSLVIEAEFASGVTATSGMVHGVVDANSEKDSQDASVAFLTVGADGFKISGIKDEINRKINALDVTGDTAQSGKYITHINEENGLISIGGRADISKAPLNDYSKGSDSGAVVSTDTVNQAISKLEVRLDGELDALDANVSGNSTHVTVGVVEEGGKITAVTVSEADIASASNLDAEIAARKAVDGQDGQTYAKNTNANYISDATSLNDADVKLDAALKALDGDVIKSVNVNGKTLAEASNSVNVQISAAAGTGAETEAIAVNTDSSTGAVTISLLGLDCGTY